MSRQANLSGAVINFDRAVGRTLLAGRGTRRPHLLRRTLGERKQLLPPVCRWWCRWWCRVQHISPDMRLHSTLRDRVPHSTRSWITPSFASRGRRRQRADAAGASAALVDGDDGRRPA